MIEVKNTLQTYNGDGIDYKYSLVVFSDLYRQRVVLRVTEQKHGVNP